jgi:hypothetical protein
MGSRSARGFLAMRAPSVTAAIIALLILHACGERSGDDATIVTLSGRPDMVTGGDALVRIDMAPRLAPAELTVTVNDADVTASFVKMPDENALVGMVTGLRAGPNLVSVSDGERELTEATLTNHPIEGPVISGPHETPFICETEQFELVTGETLGKPLDENCSVQRRVDYAYRTQAGEFAPLADLKAYPADLSRTTTSLGADAPYIVRIETGTINRAIYELAILHDPVAEPEPSPAAKPAGWNQRVVYTLGGGCPGGWFRQGARTGGVRQDVLLRQGYAMASATLNVFGNNCNDLLAAETAMMVKERFVEAYGLPLFTIGTGCSGGSYQGFQIVDNYPGIFDGIVVGCSYPDVQFATTPWNSDARLLRNYFNTLATMQWSDAEKLAVTGFVNLDIMELIGKPGGHAQRVRVGERCPDVLPDSLRYHPVNNREGARCEIFEHHINIYGRSPETNFVRRPLDNVGVQYGLRALNDGVITKAQFLDLNEKIGGYDVDGNIARARTVGDTVAMRLAYETGRLLNGGGGLAITPVIDYRGYADKQPGGNVHPRFFSFSTKERLLKANGHLDNFIMLTVDGDRYGLFSMNDPLLQIAFQQMDQWVTNIKADLSDGPPIEKIRRGKPADLVNACWTRDPEPVKVVEEQLDSDVPSRCQDLYPSGSFARGVAGSSIRTDVIKCQLKAIDAADYKVRFTEEEMVALGRIFPDGVCDWSKAGVAQHDLKATWQTIPLR